jgi:hypothetical protein
VRIAEQVRADLSLSVRLPVIGRKAAAGGERAGISEALLGMVAALAADAPEITSSVTALAHGRAAVGAGVVVGSNVFNLAALLGLGALVAGRIGLHRRVAWLSGSVALWVAPVCMLAVLGACSAVVGLILVLLVLVRGPAAAGRDHRDGAAHRPVDPGRRADRLRHAGPRGRHGGACARRGGGSCEHPAAAVARGLADAAARTHL